MCGGGAVGALEIKSGESLRKIFDKRNEPVGLSSERWLSDNLLVFEATIYELATSTIMDGDTGAEKVVNDAGDEKYVHYYLYDYAQDKLYEYDTTESYFSALRSSGYTIDKYALTELSYDVFADGDLRVTVENFLKSAGKLIPLPAGKIGLVPPNSGFEYFNNDDPMRAYKDCSKEDCRPFYRETHPTNN